MKKHPIYAIALVSWLFGCAAFREQPKTEGDRIMASRHAPKLIPYGQTPDRKPDTATIDVFNTTRPNRPYKEIGEITTTASPTWAVKYIQEGARRMGADGVIVVGPAATVHRNSMFPGKATKSAGAGLRAVVIVYLSDSTE